MLDGVQGLLAQGESVVTLVDDIKARAAIQVITGIDIDLMGTRSFLKWIEQRFGVTEAATAWAMITLAANGKVPVELKHDPIYVRVS